MKKKEERNSEKKQDRKSIKTKKETLKKRRS